MSVQKKRPQPGPCAPLTAEREQYRRLMAQELNNHQAGLQIGVNPTTGSRWSKGRNMVDHTGKARYYPPIHAEPVPISPRYLSEDERFLIGDLLAAGHSQRSVDDLPGGPPQHQYRRKLPAVRGAPQSPRPPAPAAIGQTGPRQRLAGLRAGQVGAAVKPAADLPRTARRVSQPKGKAPGARDHLPCPSTCRDVVSCAGSWPGVADRLGPTQAAPPRRCTPTAAYLAALPSARPALELLFGPLDGARRHVRRVIVERSE